MTTIWFYSIISVIFVSAVSLVGVFTLSIQTERLKKLMFLLVSFAAGALLGDVFIHLLPEFIEENEFTLQLSLMMFVGIFSMFLIEKYIHWHHCSVEDEGCPVKNVAIMNLIGDFVHNFIDGLIIGASYLVSIPVGIATTVAVIFHEIPQEIGDYAVLIHGGYTRVRALWMNLCSALGAVVGVVVSLLLSAAVDGVLVFLIPFAAGTFIYIALADLVPELHKETAVHKTLIQTLFLILGALVIASLLFLE